MTNIFDRINEITPQELERAGIIEPAKVKKTYVCPFCGNGTGKSGDGLTFKKYDWGYNYHCFGSCGGANYSAVDLIAEHFGFNQNEMSKVAEKAKELFNLQDDFIPSKRENKKVSAESMKADNIPQKDYSEFYQLAQNKLAGFLEKTGGKFRGLTYEDLMAVRAGFATSADLSAIGEKVPAGVNCLILPYDKHRFFMRQVNEVSEGYKPVKRGNTGGKKDKIYNPFNVDFEKPFFVPEGEIDALSIHKAGFQAVAVSGVGSYNLLIQELQNQKIKTARAIIMFDNDSAGKLNAEKAVQALKAAGYTAVNVILSPIEKYDANDFLQKDFSGLQERLSEIYRQAENEFEKLEREIMEAAGIRILADVLDELDEVSKKMQGDLLKWGFQTLDKKLPLLPGCYLLGALPSLGKTTLALNTAANICEQGKAVLYVSYEPLIEQIAVKDLAGYWFKKVWGKRSHSDLVPTATQIMLGKYNPMFGIDEMKEVREELKAKRKNFYFLQGRKETAQDLIAKIKPYVDNGVKFIVIDYIQLIKGTDTSKTVREQIDETIRELQIFQSENDLVILFISSFNRENYRNYACLESFKESGGLEFTADAILALQLKYSDGESRNNNEEFQKKKQQQPRDMELVILKNRFGIDFVDEFAYHSAHETFIEKRDTRDNQSSIDIS